MKKYVITIFIMCLSFNIVHAYSQETATVHAYYAHPISGLIEDSGNNPGIGQSMAESTVHTAALLESIDGKIYACVRYKLAEHISDVSFAVQSDGASSFYPVGYQKVQTTERYADYRFEIPSKESIVRSTVFVEPMGRPVVFYVKFSDFIEGNSDFLALGKNGKVGTVVTPKTNLEDSLITEATNNLQIKANTLGYNYGLLTKNSPEISSLLGDKPKDDTVALKLSRAKPWGIVTTTLFKAVLNLLVGFVLLSVMIAFLTYGLAQYLIIISYRAQGDGNESNH